jgi:prephenate dehydrogenase
MTVAVVGLGLIGGSLARALSRRGWRVLGVDRAAVVRRARRARAIHAAATLSEAAARADLVVLAAPPDANLRLLRRLARLRRPGLVVTDVGSVKLPICREAARLGLRSFVGGHPMAGSERAGFGASSARLFQGRPWALTPSPAAALGAVRRMARAAGARPVLVAPALHDRAVAFLSHLPQLVAWALDGAARRDPVARRHLGLAGPAFAEMTRLARSPRPLWREILRQNRREVARALRAFLRPLPRPAQGNKLDVSHQPRRSSDARRGR